MTSKTGYVYWQETLDGFVYFGTTEKPKSRQRAHEANGSRLLAVRPGGEDDEQKIHRQLGEPVRGSSTYAGQEIWEWLDWLLARGMAMPTFEEAVFLDHLPVAMWGPGALRQYVAENGQMDLLDELPPRERIVYRAASGQLNSISDEWNTPLNIIEAARQAMGSIDCDPATNHEAQQKIGATYFYSKQTDGLRGDATWKGNVWLNPPYGRGDRSAGAFVAGLLERFVAGETTQAVTCLNLASAETKWFRPLWEIAACHCVHYGRPDFWGSAATGSSPNKGIILSYIGTRPEKFNAAFAPFGAVVVRWTSR